MAGMVKESMVVVGILVAGGTTMSEVEISLGKMVTCGVMEVVVQQVQVHVH